MCNIEHAPHVHPSYMLGSMFGGDQNGTEYEKVNLAMDGRRLVDQIMRPRKEKGL